MIIIIIMPEFSVSYRSLPIRVTVATQCTRPPPLSPLKNVAKQIGSSNNYTSQIYGPHEGIIRAHIHTLRPPQGSLVLVADTDVPVLPDQHA